MAPPDPAKILLVDDRRPNLFALEQVLAAPGYEIVKAESGAAALAFLLRDDCAVILMDVSMPELDGYETARLIRLNPRTRDIPIVFVTAISLDERNMLDGYESGAIDYLVKPVRPEVLRSKVAGFVALYRARQEIRRQADLLREHERQQHGRTVAELELRSLQRQRAAQRRYQTLVDGLSRAIAWVLDPVTFVPKLVSPGAEALLGLPPEWWSAAPRSWVDRFPAGDAERFAQAVAALVPDGAAATLEHRMAAATGRSRWFETTVRLIAAEDSGALELHGLSADVTESVEAREASAFLARASAELSASLDLQSTIRTAVRVPLGVLAEWCLVETAGGAASPAFVAAAHEDAQADGAAASAASRLALARLRSCEAPALLEGGAPFDASGDASALERLAPARALVAPLSAHGSRVGTLCLFARDPERLDPARLPLAEELARRISQAIENALLHERTREAVRAREEFLSVASHELRTPLTALSLQARLLEQVVARAGPAAEWREELRRRIGSMQRQIGRLGALTDSVLDLTRLRSARMPLHAAPCDLAEVVRDVGARFEDVLHGEGRTLTLAVPPRLPGRWDRTRLEQLVSNLVANAVKHGGKGSVTVAVTREDDAAIVRVSDTGPGIPTAEQARIFDAFAQGRRAAAGGLGLGLYIARSIAHAHGGEISLESAEGRGAAFCVELPLEAPSPLGADDEAPEREEGAATAGSMAAP
jgi:signal transduction histidine kinase